MEDKIIKITNYKTTEEFCDTICTEFQKRSPSTSIITMDDARGVTFVLMNQRFKTCIIEYGYDELWCCTVEDIVETYKTHILSEVFV